MIPSTITKEATKLVKAIETLDKSNVKTISLNWVVADDGIVLPNMVIKYYDNRCSEYRTGVR